MTPPDSLILADTNIWASHLRAENRYLRELLENQRVAMHPFVVAELALGPLPDRMATIALFDSLPQMAIAELEEVRELIEVRSLHNKGIGLVDAQLLASLLIASVPTELWTEDKDLAESAERLGLLARPPFLQ